MEVAGPLGTPLGLAQRKRASLRALSLLLLLLSRFSHVQLCATPQMAAYQAPHPWDSPGKNTGVGCQFPLQCMKVKSEVAQSCLTLSNPMDCIPHPCTPPCARCLEFSHTLGKSGLHAHCEGERVIALESW